MPESARREQDRQVERIAALAQARDLTVAVAESLTAGHIAARLGAGEAAADWFRGAVVAYAADVKFDVLGVTPGPVVTASCAREMARGVRRLMHADVGLGITGVGGPGPEEGCPAGTVHLALAIGDAVRSSEVHLPGEPAEVVAAATTVALDELAAAMSGPSGRD